MFTIFDVIYVSPVLITKLSEYKMQGDFWIDLRVESISYKEVW